MLTTSRSKESGSSEVLTWRLSGNPISRAGREVCAISEEAAIPKIVHIHLQTVAT